MVDLIIWLVVGGVVGWLASMLMRTDAQQGIILNIVVGIIGSVIASYLFGGGINQAITVTTFAYSLVGAVILLAVVNLVRRGVVR
ncbi:MAG: GlsB/YeaQ/YmgE family stress response membrane protein [Sphingomonas sp.]|nr:GlsB/YeaQ/YmgE family stress response membrane protein [Sphingomonas sp.]